MAAQGNALSGADADIAILDPAAGRTITAAAQHQNTDFSVWEGRRLSGSVVHTVAGGRHLWSDGDLRAEAGRGRYLPRRPFGPAYGERPAVFNASFFDPQMTQMSLRHLRHLRISIPPSRQECQQGTAEKLDTEDVFQRQVFGLDDQIDGEKNWQGSIDPWRPATVPG